MTGPTDAQGPRIAAIPDAAMATLPQAYVRAPADELAEFWWLRRMDWEMVSRCVNRIRPTDTFTASWVSFLGGLTASAVIAFITVRYTIATKAAPHSGAQSFLGLLAAFGALTTVIVYTIERRARRDRTDTIQALKDEMTAAERYMKKIVEP